MFLGCFGVFKAFGESLYLFYSLIYEFFLVWGGGRIWHMLRRALGLQSLGCNLGLQRGVSKHSSEATGDVELHTLNPKP